MEDVELQPVHQCLHNLPQLSLWIIEYVWTHRMMDVLEAVDFSTWPEVDSQPLSLEGSWRLRVASAQVYSIMKNRDVEHFERVMGFLEATYRLLPRLVTPIKQMKIMFGLKTMVMMWMLREGKGMVDTVFKINQFFPSKLPQYQDRCSQHEMFLMRKNHLDFKALAQALAMDKDKLQDYIKNQMEEQYGEHYAQKVEDRLLHYLHELETVLPEDTYIDKILKKESPVTEEETLLLEVIRSDCATIARALKKLLHCDVSSCHLDMVSQPSEHGKKRMESSRLSKSVLHGSSSKALCKSAEAKTPLEFQPEIFRGGEEADQYVSRDSHLLLENDSDSDVRRHQQTEEDGDVVKRVEEESEDKEEISQRSSECVQGATSFPQFCSKHRRWVKSILQECPDESSEELLLQAIVSSSPPLFKSSSSTSSSQDLTPSDLIPCPSNQQHPSPQTSTHLQTAAQAFEQANPNNKLTSGSPGSASNTSPREPLPQRSSSRDTLLPALLSPVVRLIDITSIRGIYPTFKPHQASPNHFTMSTNKQAASVSCTRILTSPHRHTSGNDAIPQSSIKPLPQTHNISPFQSNTLPCSTISSTSNSNCMTIRSGTSRVRGAQLRLPLSSQAMLLQSKLLQPYVSLTRLSAQECYQMTEGRSSIRYIEPVVQGSNNDNNEEWRREGEEDADSSFDLNILYSSHSSSSDSKDSLASDPDYKPCFKKKRLLLEYEAARGLIHT